MMRSRRQSNTTKGNIFALLFAAVGLTGVLGVVGMQTISGPVRTMTKVNQKNITENDVMTNGRIVILNATLRADADLDPTYEPVPFETTCASNPTGGGCLPSDIGAVRTDPWGTEYGYCVWNHGSDVTTNPTEYLAGRIDTDGAVISIISAGPDKTFNTGCLAYDGNADSSLDVGGLDAAIGSSMRVTGTDDIAKAWSYAEAEAGSGGLWSDDSPTAASIDRDLTIGSTVAIDRTTGNFTTSGDGDFINVLTGGLQGKSGNPVTMTGGLQLDTATAGAVCTDAGEMMYDAVDDTIIVCDGSNYVGVSGDNWRIIDSDHGSNTFISVAGADNSTNTDEIIFNTAGSERMVIEASGEVGINNSAPASILHVTGSAGASGFATSNVSGLLVDAAGSSSAIDTFRVNTGGLEDAFTVNSLGRVGVATSGAPGSLFQVGSPSLSGGGIPIISAFTNSISSAIPVFQAVSGAGNVIDARAIGRVGIMTTGLPARTLDVVGTAQVSSDLTVDTNTLFVDATNNRVGIGTATPSTLLNIVGSDSDIRFENDGNQITSTNNGYFYLGASDAAGALGFKTGGSSTRMTIASDGNVGIGVAGAPEALLDVNGAIKLASQTTCAAGGANNGTIRYNATSDVLELCVDGTWSSASSVAQVRDIDNVNITTDPTDGFVLQWDLTNQRWDAVAASTLVAGGVTSGTIDIDDLADGATPGTSSVFLGNGSGVAVTTGYSNTAVGINTLNDNTTGYSNTAVGANTLDVNVDGWMNTAIGQGALGNNTDGTANTAIGDSALRDSVSGDNNIAVGSAALRGVPGNANIAIGGGSLLITTGSSNIAIGPTAGAALGAGSSNILIGSGVNAPTTTTSSHLNIGNLVYGNMSTDVVGIDVAIPFSKLHVDGDLLLSNSATTCGTNQQGALRLNATADGLEMCDGAGNWGAFSVDGPAPTCAETWTAQTAAEPNGWFGITYGGGEFVAVSFDGTNRVMTSPDGITWTPRAAAEANSWRSIAYGNGLYVAVSFDGTNRVMTSPDGITWTPRAAAEANGWNDVAYGGGQFVAVAQSGTNRVMTSPDGITWTPRAAAEANWWRSVTYGGGQFVAVAANGTNRVMTSPDGITWTPRAAAEANGWSKVVYGGGQFVAVAANGTNRVMTSPDGITWTPRAAAEANVWAALAYGGGQFVAVAQSGTNRIMTSSDGITWTGYTAAQASNWTKLAYGNGQFVAISLDGTNRVMTSPCATVNAGNGSALTLADADTDTLIQVEEGLDDDTIRFDTAGVERMVITPTIIQTELDLDVNTNDILNVSTVGFTATAGDAPLGGGSGGGGSADNLGDHTATEAIDLATFKLVGNGGTTGLAIASDGDATFDGNVTATSYLHSSDRRLKDQIKDIDNPFDLLDAVHGKHYVWKKDGVPAYGVIAQDVETVMPEAVATNADTDMKAVEYDQLIAPMIEALKDLRDMIMDLMDKVAALFDRTDALIEENKKLRAELDAVKSQNQDIIERLEALEAQK